MIEAAEPAGSEKEQLETMRSGPAGVAYSFERFSTSSKQLPRNSKLFSAEMNRSYIAKRKQRL
jgi:hypothetical protein